MVVEVMVILPASQRTHDHLVRSMAWPYHLVGIVVQRESVSLVRNPDPWQETNYCLHEV